MKSEKFIKSIIINKRNTVNELMYLINKTANHSYRRKLIFTLVDNFKDERIIPMLIRLIKRDDLKNYNSSIIFACNEYSTTECKKYLEFFVNIVINGDYESSWSAAQLILDFPEPYEWKEDLLDEMEKKLKTSLKDKNNKNKEFIKAILEKFE